MLVWILINFGENVNISHSANMTHSAWEIGVYPEKVKLFMIFLKEIKTKGNKAWNILRFIYSKIHLGLSRGG